MRRTTSVSAAVAHLVGPGQLKVINGQLAFTPHQQAPLRLDPSALRQLLCYGDVSVTAAALDLLFRHKVPTAWMSPAGHRCYGRLEGSDPSTTLTRLRQHQAFARLEARLAWARAVVAGKIQALIQAARHYQRHGCPSAGPVLAQLVETLERTAAAPTLDQLRGLEGSASVAWFRLLGQLLEAPWRFEQRNRRPPADPVNALLSLGYTWLLQRARARLESAGFEVYLGGLHDYRAGRPSLACDLMEPLRVSAVDRWVLYVCNRREIKPEDFQAVEEHGIHLRPGVFGTTLRSWEAHWVDQVQEEMLEKWLAELTAVVRQWSPAEVSSPEEAAL